MKVIEIDGTAIKVLRSMNVAQVIETVTGGKASISPVEAAWLKIDLIAGSGEVVEGGSVTWEIVMFDEATGDTPAKLEMREVGRTEPAKKCNPECSGTGACAGQPKHSASGPLSIGY